MDTKKRKTPEEIKELRAAMEEKERTRQELAARLAADKKTLWSALSPTLLRAQAREILDQDLSLLQPIDLAPLAQAWAGRGLPVAELDAICLARRGSGFIDLCESLKQSAALESLLVAGLARWESTSGCEALVGLAVSDGARPSAPAMELTASGWIARLWKTALGTATLSPAEASVELGLAGAERVLRKFCRRQPGFKEAFAPFCQQAIATLSLSVFLDDMDREGALPSKVERALNALAMRFNTMDMADSLAPALAALRLQLGERVARFVSIAPWSDALDGAIRGDSVPVLRALWAGAIQEGHEPQGEKVKKYQAYPTGELESSTSRNGSWVQACVAGGAFSCVNELLGLGASLGEMTRDPQADIYARRNPLDGFALSQNLDHPAAGLAMANVSTAMARRALSQGWARDRAEAVAWVEAMQASASGRSWRKRKPPEAAWWEAAQLAQSSALSSWASGQTVAPTREGPRL